MADQNSKKKWVIHYRNDCIGCYNCVLACEKYWKLDAPDGKADLIDGEEVEPGVFKRKLDSEDVAANEQAEQMCPVNIIKVT